ncbi:hypothetical protein H310_09474 [Aphanomyces invadans]|uniref:Uncharacterized protein n=1 Tax=Aphanomyces invadans TaxID=157072 RepID=A0A024TTS3_9STRA|nr:hypothetical protein H310_09474 [Aphanomyces invadans]ETV97570.1 hypothetical protein H310_09474 [Aphanomyces invadans]|eukprot:XP_008873779.1 hypothetical protein H310_09474 [Aphanomyces invadans]
MSSDYSTDDESAPPPPSATAASDHLPSISTGSSLLASLVKAKPAPLSDASESSDDDDDDDPPSHVPSEDDDDEDEDELEQLLVKQEQQATLGNTATSSSNNAANDDNLRKEPRVPTLSTSSTVCEVCGDDTSNAKRALVCAQCGVRFHPTCFRQKYAKLIQTNHLKKWFCPDCEPIKKIVVTPKGKGKGVRRSDPASARATPDAIKHSRTKPSSAATSASSSSTSATDESYARLVEVALKAGRKFNGLVLEKGEELLVLAQSLKQDVEQHLGGTAKSKGTNRSNQRDDSDDESQDEDPEVAAPVEKDAEPDTNLPPGSSMLLRKLAAGLSQLESLVYTLQYHAVQTEVELIKDVKYPPNLEQKSLEREAKEIQKAKLKVKTGGGASRLYSSAQIAKLEDWYGKSSRPESSEIQAMYRIINSPAYADAELQPEGIAVKQIRIWFDNRRAKERLDYMRIKMKDVDTTGMDSETVKKMKAAYIDEAKEVLEARVAKMRETSTGAMDIMEEAEQLLGDAPLVASSSTDDAAHATTFTPTASAYSIAAITNSTMSSPDVKKPAKAKQRLRMDHVASVRKAVKVAREAGLSEEDVKEERSRAIQQARERLYIHGKPVGPQPLNKDEVTHLKLQLLKLVEDEAAPECVMDILELLLSVDLPAPVLHDTRLDRQLRLVAKAHQDNKDVVRLAAKLSDHIQSVITSSSSSLAPVDDVDARDGDDVVKEEKPGKVSRVKFTVDQLVVLENAFQQNDSPDKDALVQLAATLNEAAVGDLSTHHDYKQLRCWFYKRKAAGHPPNALLADKPTKDDSRDHPATSDVDMGEYDEDDGGVDKDSVGDDTKAAVEEVANATKKGKSNGRIFNEKQLERMHALFDTSSRPANAVMDQLQDELNEGDGGTITKRQLKTWFSNKRAKDRQDFVKARVKEAQANGVENLEAVKEAADLEYRELNKESKDENGSDNDESDDGDDAAGKRKKSGGKQPAKKKLKRQT